MEVGDIPQQSQDQAARLDKADLVVGVLADLDHDGIAAVCSDLQTLGGSPRIAVLQNDHSGNPAPSSEKNPPFLIPWPLLPQDPAGSSPVTLFDAYQSVFAAGDKLGAKACCVIASKLETATPRWVCQLAQPLLEKELDLVVPRYARHKFEGLLNSSIIAPLTRSLYGKRIHNPMGPDLGVSQRLLQKMINADGAPRSNGAHPLAALTPTALCANLQVCEVNVGARLYPPTDWMNISSLLAQVLGPVFLNMEQNAACWQRTRGSAVVPEFSEHVLVAQDAATLDTTHLVESFQLGNRDLQEIWSLVLPPATLFELKKLSRLQLTQFRMADDVWVRIIYDFALAHRLRTINRDHLLKSLTPLYLAWVASYAHDLGTAGAAAVEQRLERLAVAYELNKTYLVSRWRWPDRFNP